MNTLRKQSPILASNKSTLAWGLVFLVLFLGVGCGSEPVVNFDRFEKLPEFTGAIECKLGAFSVPIPIQEQGLELLYQLKFDFELYASIAPNQERSLKKHLAHNEGRFRDCVMNVCRSASMQEIEEPDKSMIKSRLRDAIEPFFGSVEIEHLIIPVANTEM